ncbi:60S acidic ribosomal protein (macronuclear) [Tetrahymena thermophila SB210]|uniref:Large ribosomal subunit protein P1 n=2 Tax=Tetrahymena thermophila TaxID=5911 RepID=RLA1_TETTH|nr:60S acidic ribosomal protein [Tetrahymena thermophila SB210]P24002.1 RecName: Full=Large ribosomal subunit protein P1; AltName: Full=60S acidic ribosomal protein P1; AltName: Full=Ribosomal protein L37 [Tetrahymena thermophila]AAA30126.1 ribosomal protein L37 [Tetrahymena thermophila]EAS05024.1 60S acidic ribosomal protein [Tetrahymena thermophila SB210]|eukprot:XP_001025269.1 60S acidic ribosomal protein [Tetrahymena thermophila SB210]
MSTTEIEKVVKGASYSALLLNDCGLPITAANIAALFKTAKLNGHETTFKTFEDFLKTNPITNYIGAIGGSAPAAASSAPAKKEEPKKEEPKKEEPKEEETDMDMGDLFG